MDVEPTLVEEPEHLVAELVDLLPVVEAFVRPLLVEDSCRLRGDLLVPQFQSLR